MKDDECEDVFIIPEIKFNENKNKTWKPLLRQLMISVGVWYIYLLQGLYLGAPTVITAQIRREANSTKAVTEEMSSWLSSTMVISSLPHMILLPWLFHVIGRKFTYLFVCLFSSINSIIFYNSTNIYHIIISQIFLGVCVAASNSFTPILLAEYTSPKYRGIFLTFKSASTFWGIWLSNAVGTYFHWKNIAIISFVPSLIIITIIKWPESPYWLAMQGRYHESTVSHRWLKGVDENSEKELAQLIAAHQKHQNKANSRIGNDNNKSYIRKFLKTWSLVKTSAFYKPTILCTILMLQYHLTGKLVISVYAIEVLKNMTQNESAAYKGMLILDGVTVFSMYLGCILSRYFKRRLMLFLFAITGNLFLYIISFYLYLISIGYINENHIVVISLLTIFSIATGCGPMILSSSIYGEIIPPCYQRSIMVIVGFITITMMSTTLKTAPFLFKTFKMYGVFLFYATCSTFVITIMYIYLPETKDKTIQEIENVFTGEKSMEQNETFLHDEETK